MKPKTLPSIAALARSPDPLADRHTLLRRLTVERPESRHLEWKLAIPLGRDSTPRSKYRMVKSVIAFANTDGGFVVFGVDTRGSWVGLSDSDLAKADPATFQELINSCVTPEIPGMSIAELEYETHRFLILHVPPSSRMPHVTTKEVFDDVDGTRGAQLLAKWAVYCRHGAKSDLATPEHYERMIAKRTDMVRDELLRRVKEVRVPATVNSLAAVKVYRLTDHPRAIPVRVAKRDEAADATLVHEELSEELFEGVNNILAANSLLAQGRQQFSFSPEVYYRIYAERQQVDAPIEQIELLARTGYSRLYAPSIYWLLMLEPRRAGRVIRTLYEHPRSPQTHSLLRIAMLLGPEVVSWLHERWHARWGTDSQPPDWYWALQKMVKRTGVSDRRLLALRTTAAAKMGHPEGSAPLPVAHLLRAPKDASELLTRACQRVAEGEKSLRGLCRDLDVIAYGQDFEERAAAIATGLTDDH